MRGFQIEERMMIVNMKNVVLGLQKYLLRNAIVRAELRTDC